MNQIRGKEGRDSILAGSNWWQVLLEEVALSSVAESRVKQSLRVRVMTLLGLGRMSSFR